MILLGHRSVRVVAGFGFVGGWLRGQWGSGAWLRVVPGQSGGFRSSQGEDCVQRRDRGLEHRGRKRGVIRGAAGVRSASLRE